MRRNKFVGAAYQHAAKFEGLFWQAKNTVAALDHLRPHIVEKIGKKRERTSLLGGFLGGSLGESSCESVCLKARGEKCGWAADDLMQRRLAQRRHIDLIMHVKERRVSLQLTEKIRAEAH